MNAEVKIKTDKHISRNRQRVCSKCKDKIAYNTECYTVSYNEYYQSLHKYGVTLQQSYHTNCYKLLYETK